MKIEGKRVSGTMRIARALEALRPDPPLFTRDDLEGEEAWADAVLQDGVRQMARWAVGKDPEAMGTFLEDARMMVPTPALRKALPAIRPIVLAQMRTRDEGARACLEALPAQLDRVDALLAEGIIGGAQPNVVDYQVAPSVRLMLTFDQLREPIDARPAGRHARRLVPRYPGRFRDVFPRDWLPSLG
jgi:glutathione S-transferase